jgi:ribosomal protein S27AE
VSATDLVKTRTHLCPGAHCTQFTAQIDELCEDCWAFRTVLHQRIGAYWLSVHANLVPSARHGQRVTGGAGPASRPPWNQSAFTAVETTLAVVVGWASRIRERAGMTPLPGLSMARTSYLFEQAMPVLSQGDDTLNATEKIEYYDDLYRVSRSLVLVAQDEVRESEHVAVACPECGRMTVIARDFGDRMYCLTCTSEWGQAAWHARLSRVHVVV